MHGGSRHDAEEEEREEKKPPSSPIGIWILVGVNAGLDDRPQVPGGVAGATGRPGVGCLPPQIK